MRMSTPHGIVVYTIRFEIFYKSLKTRSFIPFKWLGVCFVTRVADPKYILEGCHSCDTFIILTKTPFFIKSITKTTTNVNINRGEDGIFGYIDTFPIDTLLSPLPYLKFRTAPLLQYRINHIYKLP